MLRCSIVAVVAICCATAVKACNPEAPPPTLDELAKAEATFMETDSAIRRVAAYSTMLATRDGALRDTVLAMGFASGDPNIRAAALRCKFLSTNSMTVRSLDFADALEAMPDINGKARDLVEAGVSETYTFHYVDPDAGCASINFHYDDECRDALKATVSGPIVAFVNDRNRNGRFVLADDNRLVGELNLWNGSGYDTIPAAAFLD